MNQDEFERWLDHITRVMRQRMDDAQRQRFIQSLHGEFCEHCGRDLEKIKGGRCHYHDDE